MADAIAELLVRMASDILGNEPNPSPERPPKPVKLKVVQAHPLHAEFVEAMKADEILRAIFPDDDEDRKIIRSHRPRSVATNLISASLWHCWREELAIPEQALQKLPLLTALFRDLVSVGKINGTVLVAISATLPTGISLNSPHGVLRTRRPTDTAIFQDLMSGDRVPEGGSILECPVSLSWGTKPGEAGTVYVPSLEDVKWQILCLAISLGLDAEIQRPVIPWAVTQINPLSFGIWGGGSCNSLACWGPSIQPAEIQPIHSHLQNSFIARLPETAIRRFLSSCSRRGEHIDSFIDAVICWESLFAGADSGELSYRISMNMASVSEDAGQQRVEIQRRVKKLYNERSKIVHGQKHLESAEAHALRTEAHKLSVVALQRLVTKHPQLIAAKSQTFVEFLLGANH